MAVGAAMRGRDGIDKPWEQKLELRKDEYSNSISTVQKDSFVLVAETPRGGYGEIIRIGQTSNDGSQAGMAYDPDGIFPTVCACTHGYAIGYVLVKVKQKEN